MNTDKIKCMRCGKAKSKENLVKYWYGRSKKVPIGVCIGCKAKSRKEYRHLHYLKNKKRVYEQARLWKLNNKERFSEWSKKYRKEFRMKKRIEVLNHYGAECKCCGEKTFEFLTIDHINGGGNKHRKKIGTKDMHMWLHEQNFPKGFQVLCFNCNCGRSLTKNKICPHKMK